MGRHLHWYVIPNNITHDTSKTCFGFEYQPNEEEKNDIIYRRITNDIEYHKDIMSLSTPDFIKKWPISKSIAYHNKVKDCVINFTYDNEHEWCPLCRIYSEGLHDSPLVIAEYNVSHSYSNPIWMSDWNVRNFFMGDDSHDFIKRFDYNRMYRMITASTFSYVCNELDMKGHAYRTEDQEAKKECEDVLSFIKTWLNKENVWVIMQDDI